MATFGKEPQRPDPVEEIEAKRKPGPGAYELQVTTHTPQALDFARLLRV